MNLGKLRCQYKHKYVTEDEGKGKGWRIYLCPYCKQFHRATDKNYIRNKAGKYKGGWYSIKDNQASIWSDFDDYRNGIPAELVVEVKSISNAEEYIERLQENN